MRLRSGMGFLVRLRSLLKDSPGAKALKGFGLPKPRPVLCVDAVGLGMLPEPSNSQSFRLLLEWAEAQRVIGFKRDLIGVDLICLRFEKADGCEDEVNEEMAGWDELLAVLPARLPGALPPFATNETVVFERRAAPAGQHL